MQPVKKNILFISYDGMTDPLGQSQIIPYMQGLSKKGYQIFILSCEKKQAFVQHEAAVKNMLEGYSIQWHTVMYTKSPPVLSTIKDIVNLRRAAKKIHRKHSIDLVHTRPGIPALVGLWMKNKFHIRFLHDIREFYADSRVDGGIWNIRNPLFRNIYHYFKNKEAAQTSACDGMVCLTYAAEKIIRQQPAFKKNTPLAVIPCSADMQLFDPANITDQQKEALKKELNIQHCDFIVSYLGSVGGWYMTDEMMQFCKLLSDKKSNAKFLFITPHLHDVITQKAADAGIPKEKIIIRQSKRNEVPALLALSHYSLFFIKPCFSKLSSSPTKHGEIMAMGIPVITNAGVGDVKEIIERYQSGFVVDEFAEKSFLQVADAITAGKSFDATAIRKGACEYYSLTKAVEQYAAMYKAILYK